ncbi:MAG: hypothetical protein ACI85Q_001376 [Salibacteraceae bacterium]|jgi:hypothetical protein
MKNYFLLALFLGVSAFGFSQITQSAIKSFESKNLDAIESVGLRASGAPNSIASVDTLWFDDFSDTLSWNYIGGVDEWNIDDSLTPSLISQGFDDVLLSASGGNFAMIDSDGSGSTGVQDALIEYIGGGIDCSSSLNVQLVFDTYLRQYQETRQVLVSNDGGLVWDTINVLTQFGGSTSSSNPFTEYVDISAAAGGQSNVMIKFRYVGSFDWFWAIDDVLITTIPNNEIELVQELYNGQSDLTYANYYSMIPLKQADSVSLLFAAIVRNNGTVDQTNTNVVVDVAFNGASMFSDTTDSVTINSSMEHSFDFMNAFVPDSGLGIYDLRFETRSDSIDVLPVNNVITNQFEVSSYQYRRDNDSVNSDNWYAVSNSWEMLLKYELYTQDTIVGLSTYFPFNFLTNRGLAEGDSISYYVYESSDLVNPISVNENYIIQQSDVNSWVSLPMPFETLTKGIYYVGFRINTNNGSVGTNSNMNGSTAPLTVLVRTDALASNDPWQFTTSFTPFVRVFTKTDNGCTGVSIDIDLLVTDTLEIGAVETTVSGSGAAPFNYSWTGPNGFAATTKNLTGLEEQGNYYLTVTDIFGCEGKDTAMVAGSVSIEELKSVFEFNVSPNPNNGVFKLHGTTLAPGEYSVTVLNMLGAIVFQNMIKVTSDFSLSFDLQSQKSGIYVVTISNDTVHSFQRVLKH